MSSYAQIEPTTSIPEDEAPSLRLQEGNANALDLDELTDPVFFILLHASLA